MHDEPDTESVAHGPRSLPHLAVAIAQAGAAAGHDAAAWWEQDTLGGRATGDTRARAATILRGLDDIDPAVLDALPTAPADLSDIYCDAITPDAQAWSALDETDRDTLHGTFREAFDAALHDEVSRLCRNASTDDPRSYA